MNISNQLLLDAKEFATQAHAGQKYGDEPYTYHLSAVSAVARRFKQPRIIQLAAWLHDVIEDTDTKIEKIEALFGEEAAKLVWAVTDEPGRSRRERARKTLPKMRRAGPQAVALKLCDRIANVEASLGTDKLQMYEKDYTVFRGILYEPYECDAMWARLDGLLLTGLPGVVK